MTERNDEDCCFICGQPFKAGEMVLHDVTEGLGHRACFGEDREGYVHLDTGNPLVGDDPLPTGFPYDPAEFADPAPTERKVSSERVSASSSVKTVPEALEQLRIAVEAEAAAKAKRDQFLATIYVNVQKSEPTAEFAVALRDFVREEWPKLSAIEAPPSRLARNGWSCCKDIRESGRRERDDPCALCIEAPAAASEVTEEMVERGLAYYSEGGCMGLSTDERREVVRDILTAALKGDR